MLTTRLVLDSSVLVAAARPWEPSHTDALDFVERLRSALAASTARAFAPMELWLETHVAAERLAHSRKRSPISTDPMHDLSIELVTPERHEDVVEFLGRLTQRMHGKRPSANATDLAYVWAAATAGAVLVTLDAGLLAYHGVVCDVTRPQHVRLG